METSNPQHSFPTPTSDPVAIVAQVKEELTGDNDGIPPAQTYANVIYFGQQDTMNLIRSAIIRFD